MHALLLAALTLVAPPSSAQDESTEVPARGATLLVLHKSENTLSLFDPESGERLVTRPTGAGPHEAAVSPDGRWAVVCDYGHQQPGNTLTVFDCHELEIVRTVDLGEYRRPHGIEFTPDGKHVLVTVEVNRAIVRVDPHEGNVIEAVSTEQRASHMLAQAPDGKRAYVANIADGTVSVLDLVEKKLVENVTTGAGAEGIAVTPDGKEVWVGNRSADTVSVMNASSLKIEADLPCGQFPIRVKLTLDGRHALVSNASSGDVAVFDVAERKEVARIPMGFDATSDREKRLFGDRFGQSPVPVGILMDPGGKRAYVANTNADIVTVLDLETWKVADRIATGKEPDGMAWVPAPAE